jgi:4'-phosphopantetheinyl transferase
MRRLTEQWVPRPAGYKIEPGTVHVWKSQFEFDALLSSEFRGCLSKEEIEKARRFVSRSDQDRYVFSHGLLRTILGGYLCCDPRQLNYNTNQYGKPFLISSFRDTEIRFNLSHSRDMTLVAISCGIEVGIDIEYMREIEDARDIVNQSFSSHERQIFNALPPAELEEAFYAFWTSKEAFLKGIGNGLSYPLDRFSILFSNTTNGGVVNISNGLIDANHWNVLRLFPGDGYAGALAMEVPATTLKFYEYFK